MRAWRARDARRLQTPNDEAADHQPIGRVEPGLEEGTTVNGAAIVQEQGLTRFRVCPSHRLVPAATGGSRSGRRADRRTAGKVRCPGLN